jgi:GTP cyclohydrolase I
MGLTHEEALAARNENANGHMPHEMSVPGLEEVQKAVELILHSCNADMNDPNFTETPQRVAKAFVNYWLAGYGQKVEDVLTVFPNEGEGDLVVVKDIPLYSMCSHHLAPFKGYAAIAYQPGALVMGLSKTSRILDVFARRLQLQERITAQVADAIQTHLNPKGVLVVLYNVEHMCMTSRGVQAHGSTTTTQAARGSFKDSEGLRAEAYRLIGI